MDFSFVLCLLLEVLQFSFFMQVYIHIELILWMKWGSINSHLVPFVDRLSFFHWIILVPLLNVEWPCADLFLDFLFFSIDLYVVVLNSTLYLPIIFSLKNCFSSNTFWMTFVNFYKTALVFALSEKETTVQYDIFD